jgi:DNA-binding IclR family transcriptional regulator
MFHFYYLLARTRPPLSRIFWSFALGALKNGFTIVEAIVGAGTSGLAFSQIAEQTGLPKASTHRLLKELLALGALSFDETSRCYRGGTKLARIGAQLIADYDLRRVVHPHLRALHETTGHVATLGILSSDLGIYIDKIESRDFGIRLHSEIGKAFPLHCTAMGKVLLAASDAVDRRRLLKRKFEAYTDHTITKSSALRAELEAVTEQGYAVDREEITRGMMCVAAAVLDARGFTVGAMSCTFPTYVFEDEGIDKQITAVRQHACAASGLQ